MTGMRVPVSIAVVLLGLVLGACGGSDESEADAPTSTTQVETDGSESTTSTAIEPTDPKDDTTTTTGLSEDTGGLNSDNPRTDVSHATVVVGDEVFHFAQVNETGQFDENGVCDPAFLGVQFKAILLRIDDQGASVPMENTGDLVMYQGATFAFTDVGPEEWIVAIPDMWQAAIPFGGGSVDSVTIDGNTAKGTATFVNLAEDGPGENATEGSFEVVCVG